MASVTFPVTLGGSGQTISDDADPNTGLANGGHRLRFVPALQGTIDMAAHASQKAGEADTSAQSAGASAQQASDDRDSINMDLQQLDQRVQDADASATAAADSATTATNMADAVAEATATYTSISAGLADTVDTDYFRVITAPTANEIAVYRNDAGAATPITTYYTKGGVDERNAHATRLARSLQRLGDRGQTLHADFAYGAYGVGTMDDVGVSQPQGGEELFTVERATPKWVFGPNGKLREVPANTIARQWNPETGEPEGVLIEESRTNLLLWSEDFTQGAWWTRGNTTAVSKTDSTCPVGETVFQLDSDDNGAAYISFGASLMGGLVYTASRFVKFETGDELYGFSSDGFDEFSWSVEFSEASEGVLSVSNAVGGYRYIGNKWYRIWFTATCTDSGDVRVQNNVFGYPDSAINASIGVVFEEGSSPSSYIPTTDAPVTRAADNVSRELGAEFNPSEGTVIVDVSDFAYNASVTGFQALTSISNSSDSGNRIEIVTDSGGEGIRVDLFSGGVRQHSFFREPIAPGPVKFGISWSNEGDLYVVRDGFVINTGVAISSPVGINTIRVGRSVIENTAPYAELSGVRYYPRALTEAELIDLTS